MQFLHYRVRCRSLNAYMLAVMVADNRMGCAPLRGQQ